MFGPWSSVQYKVLIDLHFYSMKSTIEPANMILEFVGGEIGLPT